MGAVIPMPKKNGTKLAVGLSFCAMSMAWSSAEWSASNSSSFSYSNFIVDAETMRSAKDAMARGLIWGIVGSGAIGLMSYVATNSPAWGLGAFATGAGTAAAYYLDFDGHIRKIVKEKGIMVV